ncbi:MAG: hypothetical protein COW56_00030, partial [Rhodocyclales bacterium CG17_big_fil_post_rev_8_21_14_2_50_68_7]
EKLVAALERLRLKLPEDPDGFESYMDPKTHQMQQVIAIGEVVADERFPPAKTMLGRFKAYPPEVPVQGRQADFQRSKGGRHERQ